MTRERSGTAPPTDRKATWWPGRQVVSRAGGHYRQGTVKFLKRPSMVGTENTLNYCQLLPVVTMGTGSPADRGHSVENVGVNRS